MSSPALSERRADSFRRGCSREFRQANPRNMASGTFGGSGKEKPSRRACAAKLCAVSAIAVAQGRRRPYPQQVNERIRIESQAPQAASFRRAT